MAELLFVSKPVAPPWTDSSKNLVRDLATGMRRHRARVMGVRGQALTLGDALIEPVYAPRAGGYAPPMADQLRVLYRLGLGPKPAALHYFFAPNARTSSVARALMRLRPAPTLHSICSAPRPEVDPKAVLFADLNVVMSRHTEQLFLRRGVPAERLRRVPPAVAPLHAPPAEDRAAARRLLGLPTGAALWVYPGDLEFGGGAGLVLEAHARLPGRPLLGMACRAKTAAAKESERALREKAARLGVADRVRWIGETPHIHALLGTADVIALPSTELFAKMDLPLVLIEGMWMARPVVVARGAPSEELVEGGGAVAVEAQPEALAAEIERLLGDPRAARALGERAREVARKRYHPRSMAAAYEDLYDELIG